jgi:hypothetical protein
LVVALSVTFTVCDAQQIGLSPSDGSSSFSARLASYQTKRPEQKTPQVILGPMLVSDESAATRLAGSSRLGDANNYFQYGLAQALFWSVSFCPRLNSCESPRAPPLMDPPLSC